jgi:hypothetical protein
MGKLWFRRNYNCPGVINYVRIRDIQYSYPAVIYKVNPETRKKLRVNLRLL